MCMRIKVMILGFLMTIFVVSFVSAGIFIEPLNEVYNYGDHLTVKTNLIPSATVAGHYTVDLKCGTNLTLNIFNQFFNLQSGFEQPVQITTQLTNLLLNNLTSSCYLLAIFGSDVVDSNEFSLSKNIFVELELEFDELAPGKKIYLDGVAIKESGVPLNGFVELSVPSLNLYKSGTVSNGIVNISILVPENAKSGKHNISVEVHDSSASGIVLNSGRFSDEVKISQILNDVEIRVVDEEIVPGNEEFIFQIVARDQAGDPIPREVNILVLDPKSLPFIKKIVKSNENQKIVFYLNNTPGYWSIELNLGEITKRKLFYVAEVQKLQTSLINDTLIVTNIGNSHFNGPLEITIGSFVEVKQISLDVGETKKFNLEAPEGTYSISIINDGEYKVLGSTFLTGNVIKVSDLREGIIDTIKTPIIWWLVAILFVLIFVLVQVKLRLQHRPSATPLMASKNMDLPLKKVNLPETKSVMTGNTSFQKQMPSSSSIKTSDISRPIPQSVNNIFPDTQTGTRERAVVIALRTITSRSSDYTEQTINSALSVAQETGAKIYVDGNFKIILFSPRLTQNSENSVLAVHTAKRLESMLIEHNNVHPEKINFGIGVHDGDIISEIEKGKFHFTSVGNVVSAAKRVAQNAMMKILLTDNIRTKVANTIKTERSPSFPNMWEITRIIDRAKNGGFLHDFGKRNR